MPGTDALLYQPPTSTITSAKPAKLNRVILPLVPNVALTRLESVSPATQLRLAASGGGTPS